MFNNTSTAIVITDPQVEFLKPSGAGYGLTKDILAKYHTIEHLIALVKGAKAKGYKVFISPHYYYNHDEPWTFGGQGEQMMLANHMFHRDDQYQPVVAGSGADFIEELKPSLDAGTIITSPHKIFGPESNDLALQLRKNGINEILLAGMNANLCVDSHLRELVEQGFHAHVVADATGAPGQAAYDAAVTNFGFVGDKLYSTQEALAEL